MDNTYTVDTSNIFFLNDTNQDLENMHNVFKVNLTKKYQYSHIEKLSNCSIKVIFDENTIVNDDIIQEILNTTETYKVSSMRTAIDYAAEQVDKRTQLLILQGTFYDGHLFSLSEHAQRNWIAIKSSIDIYEEHNLFPVGASTATGGQYMLTDSNHIKSFTSYMLFSVSKHLDSGRALKMQIMAINTVAELRSIKDRRKIV